MNYKSQCFELGTADDEEGYYDRWTRQYSEVVKTNMCDYFGWFNVKISEETKKFCQTLPGTSLIMQHVT